MSTKQKRKVQKKVDLKKRYKENHPEEFAVCEYCKTKNVEDNHLEFCPKFLASFEEQYEGNFEKVDPTTSRSQTHMETVRNTLPNLEEDDDIAIFTCGQVMAYFPTFFSKEDKEKVHSLMMKRLPFCTDFCIKDRKLVQRFDTRDPSSLYYNLEVQMMFLDSGGW